MWFTFTTQGMSGRVGPNVSYPVQPPIGRLTILNGYQYWTFDHGTTLTLVAKGANEAGHNIVAAPIAATITVTAGQTLVMVVGQIGTAAAAP